MNEHEINGFEIERFNQYGLKVGATASICPLCSHDRKKSKDKCMALDWSRGIGTCQHCGEKIQLHTFKKKTKTYLKPKTHVVYTLDDRIRNWFSSRGISQQTLEKARVSSIPRWIQFNYYRHGELVNIKKRDAEKNFTLEKGCELIWYNYDALFSNSEVIVCEGEIDALSFMEAGFQNVVSVPNGAQNFSFLDTSIDIFESIDKVYLSMDNDAPGKKLEEELIRRIGADKIYIVDLGEHKDANEALVKDGAEALVKAVNKAKPLPLEHVNTIDDIREEIIEFFRTGGPQGFKCGIASLDAIFTVLTGQYCVVTAVPTAGKTYFVDQYALGVNKENGWKVAMASVESKPDWIAGSQLARKMLGDYPDKVDPLKKDLGETLDFLNENFFFINLDSFTLESVLRKATELVRRKGIKMLVLDPINRIRGKEKQSIGEYTIEYFSKIDEWAKRYNCFVMVVAHPHKITKLENGEWPEMNYYNIAGGADIANMAYHILTLHRAVNGIMTLKVLKCKYNFLGENGASTQFNYDSRSTNFEPL